MSKLADSSEVSWPTVHAAIKGAKVSLATALKLSVATGGEVPYTLLTEERLPGGAEAA